MTKGSLSILSTKAPEETPKLKEKLVNIVGERRQAAIESVSKTVVYHVEMGATAIMVDDIPNVLGNDMPFIEGWLEDQGFKLEKPRFGGRTKVILHTD
jgi:hypothetical protein